MVAKSKVLLSWPSWLLEAGPRLGYLVHANITTQPTTQYANGEESSVEQEVSARKAGLTRVSPGLVAGVGYQRANGLNFTQVWQVLRSDSLTAALPASAKWDNPADEWLLQ